MLIGKQLHLNITHLYPQNMNLYGDLGNIITLKKRLEWRGYKITINNVEIGESINNLQTDIYFFGGGQDKDQVKVFKDLVKTKKHKLIEDIEKGIPLLAICGGYQLLGKYFLDSDGNKIEGIAIAEFETIAPSADMKQRAVGNLVTEILNPEIYDHYTKLRTLVGFENHSGRTRLNDLEKIKPLGKVLYGFGDNEDKISDGMIYKNVIGTYMHGSVLPKNPHLADFIIKKALEIKLNDQNTNLDELDDRIEINAHRRILEICKIKIKN